ncbi:hypothetical protein AA309_11190 [Microvirga vignae]|uniref:Uncharacterized protein n=1 Tax=Microvirga vignae TaxID=1225564 RepID=A0A0H1RDF3_9HYPH|nr:hypothetical protein AA309_11190 [Microvirga vignae]
MAATGAAMTRRVSLAMQADGMAGSDPRITSGDGHDEVETGHSKTAQGKRTGMAGTKPAMTRGLMGEHA